MIIAGTVIMILVPFLKILKMACAKLYNVSAENCCP